jgi:hypothetical protein
MADVARNLDPRKVEHDQYWSPAIDRRLTTPAAELCPRCGTEFIIGSRYCYVCGTDRDLPGIRNKGSFDWKRLVDFHKLEARMGIGIQAFVAFIAGCLCLLAAALVGVMYTATTMIDWQAVQLWRTEWLLAGIAAFVAGCLLKKPKTIE